jgi:glyoxylase-like metal-dependent hydrolase (beta-lactamase superfamily II)
MKVETLCLGPLATNCYLVEIGETLVVIDPGEPEVTLLQAIEDREIRWVLNTHGHFDHVGGNWELAKRGAPLAIHPEDMPFLDEWFPDHTPVDHLLADGEHIADALKVLSLPGHSPGSVIFATDDTIFGGDLLFAGSIGRTDLPGGSPETMIRSLRALLAFPDETMVFPGHGPPTTIGRERATNPFLRGLEVRRG